jgi:uncharacterized membrane protein YhaH (DUF805 family)
MNDFWVLFGCATIVLAFLFGIALIIKASND